MRRAVASLVDAVRGLGIFAVEAQGGRRVRIGCDRSEFPDRLAEIHDALEAVDADGGAAAVTEDAERMRAGLEALMRFASMRGIPKAELEDVVRQAVTERSRPPEGLVLKHKPYKPAKKWKPRLSLPDDRLGFLAKETSRRRFVEDSGKVLATLGAAAPEAAPGR